MDLTNAAALVTGGSSGIGRSIAQALIGAGARVAITGRHQGRLDRAAQEIGAHPIQADVSKEADAQRTMREVLEKLGGLDILVNNAGVGVFKPLVDTDLATFERTFAIDVTGAMLMMLPARRFTK